MAYGTCFCVRVYWSFYVVLNRIEIVYSLKNRNLIKSKEFNKFAIPKRQTSLAEDSQTSHCSTHYENVFNIHDVLYNEINIKKQYLNQKFIYSRIVYLIE